MFCVLKSFFFLLLVHCATSEVFLQNKDANQVFTRHRRANSMFEEFKKGDMERECREERCSYEEAREIFENKEKTDEFWNVYYDGDACTSQPCLNNGVCKDGIDKYVCYCPEMFQGYNCEIDIPQLCENKNGACEHFCTVERNTAVCSCAKGYKLAADGKSCNSDGEFDTLNREGHEVTHAVDQVLVHMNYVPETYHNDIALIKLVKPITFTKYILPACLPERDFAERVLMQQEDGMVSGFGRVFEGGPQSTILQKLTVPFIDRATCMESTKFKISNRMFCAGYDQETKDACQGDSGGPHVTKYKNTWFVTGVVSWGEGCARKGKYGVYTQVSKYIKWIESVMERVMPKKGASGKAREKRQTLGYTPVIRM